MELKDELKQLGEAVEAASEQMQGQLNNIGHIWLPVSLASLMGAIGLQASFHVLLLWVPTSFILWVLFCIWSGFNQLRGVRTANNDALLRRYAKLSNKRRTIGLETVVKRLIPLSQAGATVYVISAGILVLAKAGIINSPENHSVWMPLAVDLLLAALFLGGPILYRRLGVSKLDEAVNVLRNRTTLLNLVQTHLILVCGIFLIFGALVVFVYFGLPIWSLITTWGLYHSSANWYTVVLVLTLQVLSFVLLSGYLTQQSARTELTNNVTNLSNISLRINQMAGSHPISVIDIRNLKRQYYEAIKYRFIQERVFGFIPVYMPVLNEAYVRSDSK
jgi:hypothetical protein